jgi:uncharacterized repeat protein (TIGR01451 family)
MKYFKRTIALILVLSTILGLTGQNVKAANGECSGNADVCMFNDVYDNAAGFWVPTQITGVNNGYYYFKIQVWNRTGYTINNVVAKDVLPSSLVYVPNSMTITALGAPFTAENLFNGVGINLGSIVHTQSLQINFMVKVLDTPAGTSTLTNSATITTSNASVFSPAPTTNDGTDTAAIIVTSSGPTTGKAVINEINFNSLRDWNTNIDNRLWNRGTVDVSDRYVELAIKTDSLNLMSPDWTVTLIPNTVPATPVTVNLSASGVFHYFSTTGGTATNTRNGDYVVVTPPSPLPVTGNERIQLKYLGTVMDEVMYNVTNSSVLVETLSRNASGSMVMNTATPGAANDVPTDNPYSAAVYTLSSSSNPKGEEINDASATNGKAVLLNSSLDTAGTVFSIQKSSLPAGYYRATLRLKTLNADNVNGKNPFASFDAIYFNGAAYDTVGFNIRGRDMAINNTYTDFPIEFYKPASGGTDTFRVNFAPTGGTSIVIDNIRIDSITPNNALPRVFEAENQHFNVGFRLNDAGTMVAFSPKAEGGQGKHLSYGPYTASFISPSNTGNKYNATFRLKALNVTGLPTDKAARIEIFDVQANLYRYRELSNADLTSGYSDYSLVFPTAAHGSLEFRVVNYGTSDIYYDKVTITANGDQTIVYEAENDFEYPNGARIQERSDGIAGREVISTVANNNAGFMMRGPYTIDQTNTGKYYRADFKLRNTGDTTNTNIAAMIMVRNWDDNGKSLGHMYITANMLNASSGYQTYSIYFKSPTFGRITYDVYFYDVVDVMCDYVSVTELASQPLSNFSLEAENMTRFANGIVVEDSAASNDINHPTGLAVQARDGADNGTNVIFSDSQEYFPAGNYTATIYLRKTNSGATNNPIIDWTIKDANGSTYAYKEFKENELNTTYTQYSLNFSLSGSARIYHKMYFNGGLGNSVLIDKVVLTKN